MIFNPVSKIVAIVLVLLGLSGAVVASHPYHVSLAEIELNSKTGNFEVALCVWPADLEKALAIQLDKPVDLDKLSDLDRHLAAYVSRHFQIMNLKGQPADIRWVGHQKDLKKAWLYFEVKTGQEQNNWTLENRVFFELNEDQSNQVNLKIGDKKRSLVYSIDTSKHALK